MGRSGVFTVGCSLPRVATSVDGRVAGRTDGPHPGEALGDQTSGMSMEAMSASMPAPTSAIIAARAFALAPA